MYELINQIRIFLSIKHFSRLPQEVYKILVNHFSQKASYDFMTIDSLTNGFSTNKVRSIFHICEPSIFTLKDGLCLGF